MPAGRAKAELRLRLEARRAEIEAAAMMRVNAIADSSAVADPSYVDGLRSAVAAAIGYALEAVGREETEPAPVPINLLAQARIAARSGVNLDTVLRRYFAGYSLFGYFMIEEAGREGLIGPAELQNQIAAQATIFDHLLRAVSEEHTHESAALRLASEHRTARRIERLLEGELIDTAELAYDFEGWHVGVVAESEAEIRELLAGLDGRHLFLSREKQAAWAWLGSRQPPDLQRLLKRATHSAPIAIGEPGEGLAGWRLTHRQAAAALPVAQRKGGGAVRYGEVALLASAMQDELLVSSLRRLYLEPLDSERDAGAALRETLRAYLASGGSLSSAAARVGVSPRTIANRLHRFEEKIGRPLHSGLADIETALRLERLERRDEPFRIEKPSPA